MTQHTKKIGVDRIWQICLVAARDAYLSLRDTIQGDPFNKIFSSFTFCRVSYLNCQTRSKLYFAVYSLWPKLNEHIKFNTKAFLKLSNFTQTIQCHYCKMYSIQLYVFREECFKVYAKSWLLSFDHSRADREHGQAPVCHQIKRSLVSLASFFGCQAAYIRGHGLLLLSKTKSQNVKCSVASAAQVDVAARNIAANLVDCNNAIEHIYIGL